MPIQIEYKDVENKLLLLYLINRLELPMTRAQITDFIIQKELMSYYTMEETLFTMVEAGLLEAENEVAAQDENTTRYFISTEGLTTLEFFESHIPKHVRQLINQYIDDNRGKIKRDYESTANYFHDASAEEFKVKCGVYEDQRALLELSISVATREQAKLIQSNWKANAGKIYTKIIEVLAEN